MRIVFDTASFVTAIRSGVGAAYEIVDRILHGRITALMDYKLGMEYRDVALRKEHIAASVLSAEEIGKLIRALEAVAEPVEISIKHRPLSSDPNDDMVLDVAINGKADVIVTRNKKHFQAAARFEIVVLSPAELLQRIREREE